MSNRTIRIIDMLCSVTNWNGSIKSVTETRTEHAISQRWHHVVAQCDDEIKRWSIKRDKVLARLQQTIDSLTDDELDLIRRRYEPEKLAKQLTEIGAKPRW